MYHPLDVQPLVIWIIGLGTADPKILLVVSTLGPGGAERVVSRMANFWAAAGRDVGVLTLNGREPDHYEIDTRAERLHVDIMWPSANPLQSLLSTWKRARLVRRAVNEFGADVVISFIDRTNVLVLLSLLFASVPVIVSERIDPRHYDIGRMRTMLRRLLYPRSSAVVVQTESVAEWAQRFVPRANVAVIPNPLDALPPAAPMAGRDDVVIAVGRLSRQKGFDVLIRAFAASGLPARGWRLLILGQGEEHAALTAIIDAEGLQQQVELVGVVPEPWAWLNRARIFALPSRFEGFPNALLEAMALGCASIATDCPSGPRDIIEHGQNGLLVPVEDITALASALEQLAFDPAAAETMAASAPEVRERFAADRVMQQWDQLITAKLGG